MVKKGLMSKVQADADVRPSTGSPSLWRKVDEEKRVLVDYMKKRTIQDLSTKVAQTEREVAKTKLQASSQLVKKDAERKKTESIHEVEAGKKRDQESEIAKCLILSPQDGMVVYVPDQVRGGGGSQQSIVAQGGRSAKARR